MSTMVYMRILEQTPAKYDRGMRILTLGRIDRVKREIASRWVEAGQQVLEIGCGSGGLAALMSAGGARVLGIDVSEAMLEVARQRAPRAEFSHLTATEIDKLGRERFDRIVATLCFSELSPEEIELVLGQARVLLKPGGKLVIADEVPAGRWWARLLGRLLRWPLAAVTFLLTQNTTHAIQDLAGRLARAGFRIVYRGDYLFGTLSLVVAEKK